MLNWFESNWLGVVQTLAAGAQVITAALIVRLTRRLAESTDAYAKSAKDQVDELVQARLATVAPYMHVLAAGTTGTPDPYLVGLGLEVMLGNLGSGPALDIVARVEHDHLKFIPTTPPKTAAKGDEYTLAFTVNASAVDAGGQAMSQEMCLVVEYHDLASRWWVTTTPGTLNYVREANGTYGQPKVSFRVQEETVRPLDRPSVSGSVITVDRNPHVWIV